MLSFFLELLFKFLFFTPTVFLSNIVSDLLRSNFFILLVVSEKISWAFLFLSFFFFFFSQLLWNKEAYWKMSNIVSFGYTWQELLFIYCVRFDFCSHLLSSLCLCLWKQVQKHYYNEMFCFFFFYPGGQIRHFKEIECQPPVLKSSDMLNNYKTPCHGFLMQTFTLSLCPSMSLHICLTQVKLVGLGTLQLNLYLPTAIYHGVAKSRTRLSEWTGLNWYVLQGDPTSPS